MTQSIEIVLPKDVEPDFPDQCIVCCAQPNSTTKIFAQTYNPFLNLFMPIVILFGWLQIEIPICSSCKPVFKAQRWGLVFASLLFGAFAAYWLLQNFNDLSSVLKTISIPCLFIFAGLPHALAAFISPPYFDATALSDKVEYEFANTDFAVKFHSLNKRNILDSDLYEWRLYTSQKANKPLVCDASFSAASALFTFPLWFYFGRRYLTKICNVKQSVLTGISIMVLSLLSFFLFVSIVNFILIPEPTIQEIAFGPLALFATTLLIMGIIIFPTAAISGAVLYVLLLRYGKVANKSLNSDATHTTRSTR